MAKNKKKVAVYPMTFEEIKLWSEFMIKKEAPEGKEKEIEELAERVVALNDVSSILDFVVRVYDERQLQLIEQMQERVAFVDYLVAEKLGISNEEYAEYLEKFHEEMEKAVKEAEEAIKNLEEAPAEEEKEVEEVDFAQSVDGSTVRFYKEVE